jgi:ATP-dependent DNA ligase
MIISFVMAIQSFVESAKMRQVIKMADREHISYIPCGFMLCDEVKTAEEIPADWLLQEKKDGERLKIIWDGKDLISRNRRGNNNLPQFPEIREAFSSLISSLSSFEFDGELCVNDSFLDLSHRIHLMKPLMISLLSKRTPANYWVFDLLELNGVDLKRKPYRERYEALKNLNLQSSIKIIPRIEQNSIKSLEIDETKEGLVAKNPNSVYSSCRSSDWLKFKFLEECDDKVMSYEYHPEKKSCVLITEKGHRVACNKEATHLDLIKRMENGEKPIAVIRYLRGYETGLRQPILKELRW